MKRPDEALAVAVLSVGVPMDDAQVSSLGTFEALLADRAASLGMISRTDTDRVRERHILDCVRAAAVVGGSDREALDIGSGAGLPGIPVAIARPALTVRLVEPRRARVAFLELVLERVRLGNVQIVSAAIGAVDLTADVCFARAFAPIQRAWAAASPRLRPGGRLVYFAGPGIEAPERPEGCSMIELVPAPHGSLIESAGPLVIMTR